MPEAEFNQLLAEAGSSMRADRPTRVSGWVTNSRGGKPGGGTMKYQEVHMLRRESKKAQLTP